MSVRLTTSLSQRLVLTPQLRQRIEMLQMTSLELTDLIQQQLTENPVLEEVATQEEAQELAEKIIDHMASGGDMDSFDAPTVAATSPEVGDASSNGAGTTEAEALVSAESEPDYVAGDSEADFVGSDGEAVGAETTEDAATDATRDAFEEIDFGREFQDYLDPGYKTQEFEYKEDAPTFEQFLTKAPSLSEHLEWQLHMDCADVEVCDAAESVIGNLDEDGRLKATNEEIAAQGGWSEETVEKARAIVMRLEPVGCGARDVRDCLLVQLEVRGETERLATQLIRDHLEALQQHKLPHLSKQIGIDIETLAAELQFIRTLDPFPGRRYSSEEPILISPEIYIEKLEDDTEYVIYFADDGSPRLRISPSYQQMLSQATVTKETRNFIKEKMRSAVDLLRNIEHRRQTIYRVVESIVHRQKAFLDKGVEYIKPMMLKDIAEDIGMHLSTVSRVVNRKYAHTPQGVIELRRFFTEGMLNEEGEEVSTRIIKLKIKKLIEEEDSHNPITDDQVVKILVKDGIKLSRRTVAKYRDQMHIPGSRERRAIV
ncbi:MAG: RNA polymerase sigma-54 factor [Acidobacteria bacterium]|nr:MAG: RNA polymerase sigma-54 factor [Acidobacteriota bacterium]